MSIAIENKINESVHGVISSQTASDWCHLYENSQAAILVVVIIVCDSENEILEPYAELETN